MTSKSLDNALVRHAAALEAFGVAARHIDPRKWAVPQGEKWSASEVTEHLILTYEVFLHELAGNPGIRVKTKPVMRFILRWFYLPRLLRHGNIPEGVRAPRAVQPASTTVRTQDQAIAHLQALGRTLSEQVARSPRDRKVRITHPFFGKLDLARGVGFCAVHLAHHQKQLDRSP